MHRWPHTGAGIAGLAASIKDSGVLQNLVVVQGARGRYEMRAGGRRLASLMLLFTSGDIAGNYPVPVLSGVARGGTKKGPKGPFLHRGVVATDDYFLATGFAVFLGATALAAALAFGTTGAGTTGTTFSAVRWSRRALISALILSLRSVSLAMLALSLAMVLAAEETAAFFAGALITGFTTFTGAATFLGVAIAFGAVFFAVAISRFPFLFAWWRYFTSAVLSPVFPLVFHAGIQSQGICFLAAVIALGTSRLRSTRSRFPGFWEGLASRIRQLPSEPAGMEEFPICAPIRPVSLNAVLTILTSWAEARVAGLHGDYGGDCLLGSTTDFPQYASDARSRACPANSDTAFRASCAMSCGKATPPRTGGGCPVMDSKWSINTSWRNPCAVMPNFRNVMPNFSST